MKTIFKKMDRQVRKTRERAGKLSLKFPTRAFDSVAYAAVLEQLG
jgi:hypothetical protein